MCYLHRALYTQFAVLTNAEGFILGHTDFWSTQNVCQWGAKICYCKQGDKLYHPNVQLQFVNDHYLFLFFNGGTSIQAITVVLDIVPVKLQIFIV